MALPAAARRPRPTTLSSAPTKTIGSAAAVSEILTPNAATSQPVPVVPMLAPNTRLKPCGKVRSPALTSPMVVMVVALDDCTRSVMTAPQNVPSSGVAAAFSITCFKAVPASALSPSVMTAMPSRNRPTPPTMETIVSKFPPGPCVIPQWERPSVAREDALVDRPASRRSEFAARRSTRQAGDVADRHVERELERPARARRLRQQEATLQRGDHRGRELGRVRLGLELAAVAHRAASRA